MTTNLAWSPGVIFLSTSDYGRYWRTSAPTALGVELRPGADAEATRAAIARQLGPASGLEASSANALEGRINTLTSEGLSRLGDISILLMVAAVLAMAAALTSTVWQRRRSLAAKRLHGPTPRRLFAILLTEVVLMLSAGCVAGALAGVYGQLVIDGYLKHVTGFPLASIATGLRPLEIFAVVALAVLLIVSVPGWLAAHASPELAFEEQS